MLDLKTGKISNLYLLSAAGLLIVYRIGTCGKIDYVGMLVSAVVPVIILFPLFLLGLLGAGDLKCLMLFGLYGLQLKEVFVIFVFSIAFAAVIGIGKIIKYKNLRTDFTRLFRFINRLANSRFANLSARDMSYIDGLDERAKKESGIRFSVPILLGTMIYFWRCVK